MEATDIQLYIILKEHVKKILLFVISGILSS
jgi:hypothetical protein